jgi:hypothetical protein
VRSLVLLAGIAQLLLAASSLAIPFVLRWREETARLKPLTRQVFWTYAGYIWGAHVAFGLLSAISPGLLLDRTPLAASVCGFIATWWAARLAIQFVLFDRSARPPGAVYAIAEWALVALFLANASIYGAIVVRFLGGMQ